MTDWLTPETWQVGDTLNAELLNRRIRDQMSVLLRRPLTVLRNTTTTQVIATGTNTSIIWDTVDLDDDGMLMAGAPDSKIYAQREGTYQFWLNTTHQSNGTGPGTLQACIWINNDSNLRRWDYQSKGSSGVSHSRSTTGTVFLNAGEYFTAHVYQNSGANQNLQITGNTPRICVMWLGIS